MSQEQVSKATVALRATVPANMGISPVSVTAFEADAKGKTLKVELSESYADVPFTGNDVEQLKSRFRQIAGSRYKKFNVAISIKGNAIDNYLPEYNKKFARHDDAFVTPLGENLHYKKGLSGNVIALWQSHGWYFEPKINRWEWQRARLNQTVEDLYTQSYVIPFLMPMLENAGAYVMSPRDRDIHSFEVVVDGDKGRAQDGYSERNGEEKWANGSDAGFAWAREYYVDYQNPFAEGTYRQVATVKNVKKASVASWSANMPEDGTYAVYVSYKSLPESIEDAQYTVNYLDGSKTFAVNQRMGGGTWIYLGHFPLRKGDNRDVVVLSNVSKHKGVVSADAVKIGGGMGNVARKVKKPEEGERVSYTYDERIAYDYVPSQHPRFTEGSRYWLQWAGAPDSVYTLSRLTNDYNDDYRSRAEWVNWLAGGSPALPDRAGLNIPVDLSFAFHSDAGTTPDDSIIGTLGIYMTSNFDKYANGTPRAYSRLLTNAISTNICNDVRAQFEPKWTRRGMWDKSYYEARVPEVPTMLLELLSHQNFADMCYGLDPSFRFTVSRAIYKGMLEFLAKRDGREYVVQPLPVNSFAISAEGDGKFVLTWQPTADTQCSNAEPDRYIVMERVGNGAFREVAVVNGTQHKVQIADNELHSYKIVAVNDGGRSFDSEVLALGVAKESKGVVMVVNGFTRISAPDWFVAGEGENALAGFLDDKDSGVPYMYDISYIGSQFEFRRNLPWKDDDAAGFGGSHSNYETKVIAGNTFDYPCVHGASIMQAGYSFVSSSESAVENGLSLDGYFAVDLILGKQKEIKIGRGAVPNRYKIYSEALMKAIEGYTAGGGNVMVTGSYVASDVWDGITSGKREQAFARDVLGYEWRVGHAAIEGNAYAVASPFKQLLPGETYAFSCTKNEQIYCVESPDGVIPGNSNAGTIMRYSENNIPAGIAANMGAYRTVVIGFPFETIGSSNSRHSMMQQVMNFFAGKE
ncbi:MAG: xanthan lyase [Muribaculaceae bacterium]